MARNGISNKGSGSKGRFQQDSLLRRQTQAGRFTNHARTGPGGWVGPLMREPTEIAIEQQPMIA